MLTSGGFRNPPLVSISQSFQKSIYHPFSFFSKTKYKYRTMSNLALQLIQKEKEEKTGLLDIGYCGLTKIPQEVFECTWLETLILSNRYWSIEKQKWIDSQNRERNNNLHSISIHIRKLTKLKKIVIGGYMNKWKISDMSPLKNLPQLQYLYLTTNQINDYSSLQSLTKLKTLYLHSNQIKDVSFLKGLTQLQILYLRSNEISDVSFLKYLTQLQSLDLSGNQISDASFLKDLRQLQSLKLRSNEISDINFLKELTQLQYLDLRYNQIRDISPLVHLIQKGLKFSLDSRDEISSLLLYSNPITTPSPEVTIIGGEAILRHYKRMDRENEKATLYECKVLLVGRTGAGKTSMRYKLKHPNKPMPEPDESTSGIDIEAIEFEMPNGKTFRMNVWDFEGQIISHQTHQFFLTHRSQYIFVADNRTEKVDTDYWFQIVELLSGGSPMLVFHNEKEGSVARLNHEALQKRFGGFLKEKEYRADLEAVGQGKKFRKKALQGFEAFFEDLKGDLRALPIVGIELEKSWVDARESIEDLAQTEATISVSELWEICEAHGITDPLDQKDLSQLFHDLGIFLHFQAAENEEANLVSKIVILQNSWATKAVYRVLKSEFLEKQKRGHFKLKDIQKVWRTHSKADDTDYSPYTVELLQLMQKFKICYKIERSHSYILPQLLPPSPPTDYNFPDGETLQMRYAYDFMPKGIITRLTVEMHELIARNQTLAWRDGFVLEADGAVAEVVETYGKREIHIRVTGQFCRSLLHRIRIKMQEINRHYHFNEKIQAYELLPCNCVNCYGEENPYFFDYKTLKNSKIEGWDKIPCKTGKPAHIDSILSMILQGEETGYLEREEAAVFRRKLLSNQEEIKANQQRGYELLFDILLQAQHHQSELRQINRQIDAQTALPQLQQMRQLEQFIEGQLADFVKRLPEATDIAEKWREINAPSVANLESKTTLKLKLNLFFVALEKEYHYDVSPVYKSLFGNMKLMGKELKEYFKGERNFRELFWVKEEDEG